MNFCSFVPYYGPSFYYILTKILKAYIICSSIPLLSWEPSH